MIVITQAQWNALGRHYFVERFRQVLRTHHPDASTKGSDALPSDWIFGQVARAANYGMRDERSAGFFAYAAWLLGEHFDVRIPVLVQILNSGELAAEAKQRALADFLIVTFSILESGGTTRERQ